MKKKLYRNTKERLLGGVLAGLADYYGHDVVFYRLLYIILLILTGFMPGVLIYVVAWLMLPEPPRIEPLDTADYKVCE